MQIKRSISVILTAVLLCMAILMTSCDALSVKKVEEDPTEQLMSSTSSTATNVVNSISPLDPVKAALKKGLFEISYSNDEIGNISNRFYIDAEAKKAADIASVELMGEKIDLGIYGADSKLAVSSSLLGDSAYGFDFTTLAEDAKNSEFWALVGTTYSEAEAQIGDLLDSLSGFSEKEDEIKDFIGENGYFSSMFDFEETCYGKSEDGWYASKPYLTPEEYKKCIFHTQKKIGDTGMISNIIENHDEPRGVCHYISPEDRCPDSRKLLAGVYFLLKGIPFIYQGQEIGMENMEFTSMDQIDDISTIDEYQVALRKRSA